LPHGRLQVVQHQTPAMSCCMACPSLLLGCDPDHSDLSRSNVALLCFRRCITRGGLQ
jgi:hypothetical protein